VADDSRRQSLPFGRLLDDVSDAVIATRPTGEIVYVNPVATRWFDRAPASFAGLHFAEVDRDLAPGAWSEFRTRAVDRSVTSRRLNTVNGAPVAVEMRHRAVDGFDIWLCRPEPRGSGLTGATSQQLFELLPAAQFLVDPGEARIIDANAEAGALLALAPEELAGRQLPDLIDWSAAQVASELERLIDSGNASFRCRMTISGREASSVRIHAMRSWLDAAPRCHLVVHDVHDAHPLNQELTGYRDLIERLPVGVFRTTPVGDGKILMANQALCDILEASSSKELIGTSPARFYADRGGRQRLIRRVGRSDEITRGVHALVTRRGRRIWAAITGRRVRDERGRLLFEGAMEDITERMDAEARMREADRIIENAREGITITDADANILRVNPSFTRITGYTEQEVRGRNPSMLSSGKQSPEFYQQMWRDLAERDHWQGEIWNRRATGEAYPQWLTISAIRDAEGELTNYAAVFTDLTELRRSEAAVERMQQRDSLTGLFNRAEYLKRLEREITRAGKSRERLCQVVLGIDDFTRINNVYSFGVGDDVLAMLGQRFFRLLDGPAVLAGRINSDEFALLFREATDMTSVDERVTGLIELAHEPIRFRGGERLTVSVSAGVAAFPDDGRGAAELLGKAEATLGHAKRLNRGGYRVFKRELEVIEERRVWLKQELSTALDAGDLYAHYQPVVEIDTGRIVGAEALARWRHSEEGLIGPDEFIEIAEDGGLIERLTFQILEQACEDFARVRQNRGQPLPVSVNLSTRLLLDSRLPARVLAMLERTGLPPDALRLELTETRLMMNIERSLACVRELQQAGIVLSIDDFGTGFSSLAYLQQIRPKTLKIDRRFILNLPDDRADAAIASTVVAMAHALGIEVVAEGVETPEQLAYLANAGCEYFQGYLCSPPVSMEDFDTLMGTGTQ
jgi:diguanylate cyclase (GGDEF)-like protein/PAS domain S-box-containing protein